MFSTPSKNPKISIVMPTYNQAHYIGESIQTVVDQTFENWELIVINNYSDDNTEEVVKSFKDDRITLINFRNNGIIAASRNTGLMNCHGEFIAFLDSDDKWLGKKLDKQLLIIESQKDIGLVATNAITFSDSQERYLKGRADRRLNSDQLIKSNLVLNSSVLVRREIIEQVGLLDENPEIRAQEDWDFWIRISLETKIFLIAEPLTLYRVHTTNNSTEDADPIVGYIKKLNKRKVVLEKFSEIEAVKKSVKRQIDYIDRLIGTAKLNSSKKLSWSAIFQSKALLRTKLKKAITSVF